MMNDKKAATRLGLLRDALALLPWPSSALQDHAASINQCIQPLGADVLRGLRAATWQEAAGINLPLLVRSVTQSVLAIHAAARAPVTVEGLRGVRVLAQNPAYRCAYSCWRQVRGAKVGSSCPRFLTPSARNSPAFAIGGVIPPSMDENENLFVTAAGWGPVWYALDVKGVTLQVSNGRLSTFIPGIYKDYVAALADAACFTWGCLADAGCFAWDCLADVALGGVGGSV